MIEETHEPTGRALAAVYLVTLVLALVPLTLIDVPVLLDYPNHLARMYILNNVESDPLLAEKYVVNFFWQPSIAMDLLVPPLARVLPLDVAGRVFLGLILIVTLAGVALLHRALFNRWSWWPLCGAYFLYHGELLMGFVNFAFAVGLMFVVLACWIWLRESNPWLRLAVGCLLSLALYFSHVIALATYGMIVGGYELVRLVQSTSTERWRGRTLINWAVLAAQFVVPASLFLALSPLAQSEFVYIAVIWQNKLRGLFMPVLNYSLVLDVGTLVVFALLVGAGLVTRSLRISSGMVPGFLLMGLLFLFLPNIMFGAANIDHRFTTMMALLFVAGADVDIPSHRLRRVLAFGLAALFLVRIGVVAANWSAHNEDLSEFRDAIARIERGSNVLVARSLGAGIGRIWRKEPARHFVFNWVPALVHLPSLAVIEKSAFVSLVFAHPGKQTILVTQSYRDMDTDLFLPPAGDLLDHLANPDAPDAQGRLYYRWWTKFDYLFVVYAKYLADRDELVPEVLTPVFSGDLVVVYRIDAPS